MQKLLKLVLEDPDFSEVVIKQSKTISSDLQITIKQSLDADQDTVQKILKEDPELGAKLTARLLEPGRARAKKVRLDGFTKVELSSLSVFSGITPEMQVRLGKVGKLPISSITEAELANLVGSLAMRWNESPNLRQVKIIPPDVFYGYVKLRRLFTHEEIVHGIKNYVKWADAAKRAADAGTELWFHEWSLSGFLRSRKSMDHVNFEPDHFQRAKHIPDEYWSGSKSTAIHVHATNDDKRIEMIAQTLAAGGDNDWPDYYEKNKIAIDKRVQEIKDVQ